ncbi:adenosine deaminase [Janthinobacterium sp. Mn2066]|uniref:adenosine deaminase n=1 Tax=Janthinobacterium sp. Mn2066 TaxID=3395264 RepID=UPI003BD70B37
MLDLDHFIKALPKAELHMHLEGSLEAELMFELAGRNQIALRWPTPQALRAAYRFDHLQSFLALYYEGCGVLRTRADFCDVTLAYLYRAHQNGVIRAEMFLGPQSFTSRGVPIATVMDGIFDAIDEARAAFGISGALLVSVQRHRSEADAYALLDAVEPWRWRILGFGLGGAEAGNPPSKFQRFFDTCRQRGFRLTAHAGEEGPASYVAEAADVLRVDRIDHGNACLDDRALVQRLVQRQTPLTVCPLSNLRLKLVPSMDKHPLRGMLEAGLNVTVNSDDPAYFGGHVSDNLMQCAQGLGLTVQQIVTLARNSIRASFMTAQEIADGLAAIDACCAQYGVALQD